MGRFVVRWGWVMECGAEEFACQILAWLKENEFVAAALARFLGQASGHAAGILGWISAVLMEHGDKLVGLAGVTFGIYRWWRYREHILHKRLSEYLQENDQRLGQGQADFLEALQRPGPGQTSKLPLFASDELRSVLRERNWDRTAVAATVESSARWQLTTAMEKIERQLKTGEEMMTSLRHQLATAHIMRGAIASASALRSSSATDQSNNLALTSFRSALQVPGHEKHLVAKEFEAHQLRKLGQLSKALQAYLLVEQLAPAFDDYRTQRLTIARAKRYQSEIIQAQRSTIEPSGNRVFNGSTRAYDLLSEDRPESALRIRSHFAPYQGWDLLEQGDIHYLTAFVARKLDYGVVEQAQLAEAETAYQAILAEPERRLWGNNGRRRLRAIAKSGVQRVHKAQDKEYDWRWLLPS